MTRAARAIVLAAVAGAGAAGAGEPPPPPCAGTALVLSGGGARGAAHVGVLELLEAERVPVSCVIGTSMGAIVGALYASGYSPAELRAVYEELDWGEALDDRPGRRERSFRAKQDDDEALFRVELGLDHRGLVLPSGLVAGQKLAFELRRLTLHVAAIDSFDELGVPFRAVATDLADGTMVVLDRGDLTDALRASMAVPGAFTPAVLDGRVLVDGGIVNNLPVDVARSLGATRVIAVDVSTLPDREIDDRSAFGVASQTLLLLTDENVRRRRASLRPDDVLIVPALDTIGPTDFARWADAMDDGRRAAQRAIRQLRALTVTPADHDAFRSRLRSLRTGAAALGSIDRVELVGLDRVDPRFVLGRVRTRPGDRFDLVRLRRDLERIYQSGAFEQVGFDLEPDGDDRRLVIRAREKSWGPYFLRLGLSLESNFEGEGRFRALGILTRTQLNPLGAEWKTTVAMGEPDLIRTELWQPLDFRGVTFVSPQLEFRQSRQVTIDGVGSPAVSDDEFLLARLDLGAQLGNWGEIRVGAARGEVETRFSSPLGDSEETVSTGAWRARLIVDRLDHATFPRAGHLGEWTLELSRDSLGAGLEYDKLRVNLLQAASVGRNTVVGRLELGSSLGTALPAFDRFELGGFLNLSGLEPGQLRGDVLGLVSLIYYREVTRLPGPLGGGVYLGASLEGGNVWRDFDAADAGDLRPAGMLFAGADTLLGPVYFGYGRADGGADSFYLFLGLPF